MAYKIILKKRFLNKLLKTLSWLEKEWSHEAAAGFLQKLDRRLELLKQQPYMGAPSAIVKNSTGCFNYAA